MNQDYMQRMMRIVNRTGAPVILSQGEEEEPVVLMGLGQYEDFLGINGEPKHQASFSNQKPNTQQARQGFVQEESNRFHVESPEDSGDIEQMEVDLPVLETISEDSSAFQPEPVQVPGEQLASQSVQPRQAEEFSPDGEERFYLEPID